MDFTFMTCMDLLIMKKEIKDKTPNEDNEFIAEINKELKIRAQKLNGATSHDKQSKKL